jgi:hypothetical protein
MKKPTKSLARRVLANLPRAAAACALAGLLCGCAGPQLGDYAAQQPAFDLQQYFNGRVLAHGMFSDRNGRVLRRFTVSMDCQWVGDSGTLDEQFVYDDGERQRRVWRLKKLADGSFVGNADDVLGQALGAASGAAFNWRYTLKLPVDGTVYEVQFDDWMHRIDSHSVLNKAVMRKFGFALGEVTLAFQKQ